MGRRLSTGILIAIVGIMVAVVGVFLIFQVVRQSLAPLPAPTPLPPITEEVVITTRDIDLGTVIRPEDVTVIEVPVEVAPRTAMSDVNEVIGRNTEIQLIGGEMVLPHHLADPTNVSHDIAITLPDDLILIAFPATDLMSDINILQRGDLIDILVSIEQTPRTEEVGIIVSEEDQQETSQLFTFDALQRVEIAALVVDIVQSTRTTTTSTASAIQSVQDIEGTPVPTPTPDPSQIEAQALLLALTPQDALVLKHLKDAGGIFDIALRSPTSTQFFELNPVMSEYLIDRYQLEIPR